MSVSLKKADQKKFTKDVKIIKKSFKEGIISENGIKKKKERGLIYLGHIPHGFYEKEIRNYFQQFGTVSNAIVCQSRKTGKSKGFGYVEFTNTEVAKIAAETMNNYLMFNRRLIAQYIPPEKQNKRLFKGRFVSKRFPGKIQQQKTWKLKNTNVTKEVYLKKANKKLKRLQKNLEYLEQLGLKHSIKPADVPEDIQSRIETSESNNLKHKNIKTKPLKKKSIINSSLESNKDNLKNKTRDSTKMVKVIKTKKTVDLNDSNNLKNTSNKRMKIGKVIKNKKNGNAKTNLIKLAANNMLKSNHVIVTRSGMKKQVLKKKLK